LLEPFRLTEATVTVGASIGVAAVSPGLTAGDLLRCADIAMYSAKAKGKNRVELFTAEAHGGIAQLRLLEEHLAQATDRGEIILHYQPQIDLHTGRCIGVEALARWQHPTRGLLPSSAFIPLAERTGQIVTIGAHVLRMACRQTMAWSQLGGGRGLSVAVNIAPQQVTDPGFVDTVRTALEDSGLPPQQLMLEITESELIDEQRAHRQLEAVAKLGLRIAIDDFGTGYASLASLRSFPVHQLKIDRRFLNESDASRADEMLQLVVSVGKILELETVAVGIEAQQQHDFVRHAGVPVAQGHWFARPMPPEQFPNWFADREHAAATGPDQEHADVSE
jgi:predicted signal transduction protein with EAL and GGDEF domain